MLPIGSHARQVQAIRRQGKPDLLVLCAETEQWLRHGYETRMSTEAVRRDLGGCCPGEPRTGSAGRGRGPAAQADRETPADESTPPTGTEAGRRDLTSVTSTGGRVMSTAQLGVEPTAAQLAARIEIPRRLPPRLSDGQPLQHLSHSSYSRWVLCPDSWRRYYLCAERSAPTGAMFLGRQVDDAVTLYYRRILEHGEHLSLDQVRDAYWDGWKAAAEAEREQLGISWEDDLREDRAFKLGLDAIELTFKALVPRLGEPVAVQRRVEYTLGAGLEWSVLCFLDLETVRPDADGNEVALVVDYKVKTTPLSQPKADHDFQPAVYLAGRWLEGNLPPRSRSPSWRSRARAARDGGVTGEHQPVGRAAARRARADRAGSPADRRLLRALRPRGAVGIRRSRRLEVQRALLRGVAALPRRSGAVGATGRSALTSSPRTDGPDQLQRLLPRRDDGVRRALSDRSRGARQARRQRVPPRPAAVRPHPRMRLLAARRRSSARAAAPTGGVPHRQARRMRHQLHQ